MIRQWNASAVNVKEEDEAAKKKKWTSEKGDYDDLCLCIALDALDYNDKGGKE